MRINGRRFTKVVPTKDQDFIRKYEAKLRIGALDPDYQKKKREEPLFEVFAKRWLEEVVYIENSRSHYLKCEQVLRTHLNSIIGNLKIGDIDSQLFLELQRKMAREKYAVQTINNTLAVASCVFKEALSRGLVNTNPVAGIRRLKRGQRKELDVWTFEERDRFLAHLHTSDYRLFQLCLVALFTGMRPGELRGLCRDAIDFETGSIRIHRQWCQKQNKLVAYTKTREARTVTVPKSILSYISDKKQLPGDQRLFPFITNAFGDMHLKGHMEAAGVKPIRFHDFRHTFASHLLKQGSNLMEVKELLGHRKLESTMVYLHLVPDRNANVTDRLLGSLGNALSGGAKVLPINTQTASVTQN